MSFNVRDYNEKEEKKCYLIADKNILITFCSTSFYYRVGTWRREKSERVHLQNFKK